MQRVYVRTDDFQLAHHLLRELESHGLVAMQLSVSDPLPDHDAWWFGSPEEVKQLGGRGVGMTSEDVGDVLAIWAHARYAGAAPKQLVIGLDPGPRPGCAYLADGTLLGKGELDSAKEALDVVDGLVQRMMPESVLIRVGHGSPHHRDQLINALIARNYHVEEVNEYRTSAGTSRHAHGSSAFKIAMMSGKPVHEQRIIEPSMGELRNLQRISRQQSKGRLTISLEAARLVSQGVLSMDEALKDAGYEASS